MTLTPEQVAEREKRWRANLDAWAALGLGREHVNALSGLSPLAASRMTDEELLARNGLGIAKLRAIRAALSTYVFTDADYREAIESL